MVVEEAIIRIELLNSVTNSPITWILDEGSKGLAVASIGSTQEATHLRCDEDGYMV
jgi:hypothetical protein